MWLRGLGECRALVVVRLKALLRASSRFPSGTFGVGARGGGCAICTWAVHGVTEWFGLGGLKVNLAAMSRDVFN